MRRAPPPHFRPRSTDNRHCPRDRAGSADCPFDLRPPGCSRSSVSNLLFDVEWHGERERGPLPQLGFNPQPAAMHLNDALGNRKPEPGAAFLLSDGRIRLLKLLKDFPLILLSYSWPGVAHRDREASVRRRA